MSNQVGVAVVGCGNMGKTHARLLSTFEDVSLTALVDVNVDAARALQEEAPARSITSDYSDVLADADTDLVLICTHHHLHAPMCARAAEAGKHIFCEKPMAITVPDCEAIVSAVEKAGIKFMMGFQARFSPFIWKLKEAVPAPWMSIAQLIDPRWGDQSWANDPTEGGGNVLSQGCHCFDAICFMHGADVVSIYAAGGNYDHPELPITDAVACTLKFADGSSSSVTIGDVGKPALMGKAAYQLFKGDHTATLYDYYWEPKLHLWRQKESVEILEMGDLPESDDRDSAHGYLQQMRALIDWVRNDNLPEGAAFVRDGLRATLLAARAIDSIRMNQPMEVGG